VKVVQTGRLVLRPLEASDVPAYAAIRGDPEVWRWMPGGAAKAPDAAAAAAERVPRFAAHWRDRGYGVWGVVERAGGALVGHCGLNWLEQFDEVEVLYMFARPAWGKGYATEAARAAVEFGFGPAGLQRIIGLVHPQNRASQRVLEKLGLGYRHDVTFQGMRARFYQRDREARR
jgi:ribosomal-protein-alanine N-acetyltransferase